MLSQNENFFQKNPLATGALSALKPAKAALSLIPYRVAARLVMLPLEITPENRLRVMVADLGDLPGLDELKALSGMAVDPYPSGTADLKLEIERAYNFHGLIESLSSEFSEASPGPDAEESDLSGSAPVFQIVRSLINQAVSEGASDIHIEPSEQDSRVRFRIDGRLADAVHFPRKLHCSVVARVKIMSNIDIAEKRMPQDGRILSQVQGRKIDFRVSTLPSIHGEKIVMRILDRQKAALGLGGLGCDPGDLAAIESLLASSSGVILCTGPTGSGKTTTLYAMLEKLNTAEFNTVTVEDPVEYHVPGVTQVQVHERGKLSFSSALRSILRQDPDIIMVGEIRDAETASLAVRAALTGHMVLSTLHTGDAAGVPARLMDMGVPAFLIASTLTGVIAQRLVRKLCPLCRQPYELPGIQCAELGVPLNALFYKPAGCPSCGGRGYRGRTALFEIMKVDEEMAKAIMLREDADSLRRQRSAAGIRTLRGCGIVKALQGVTSLEEVLGAACD